MTLVFENVSYAYGEARNALDSVSFTLADGAFLGVVGQTGSGKTTLAQLMNALLVPTQGRVLVDGLDTADRKHRRTIRAKVGLAFQYPEQQLFASTVAEDVAFGPRNLGVSSGELERCCRDALSRVGLSYDDVADKNPFELSGGQRRRVALAGILAMEPQVLVLDEPTAGMDPATSRQLKADLRALNRDGMSVVLISHAMEDIAELASEVLCIDRGRVLLQGAPEEVFSPQNAPRLQGANLDVPRSTRFAMELAGQGLRLPGPVLTVEQLAEQLADIL